MIYRPKLIFTNRIKGQCHYESYSFRQNLGLNYSIVIGLSLAKKKKYRLISYGRNVFIKNYGFVVIFEKFLKCIIH